METNGILQLPDEILSMVFRQLDHPDLLNTRLVCRHFKEVASDRRIFKITFVKPISLQTLFQLLDYKSLVGNVHGLSLTQSDDETNRHPFSLTTHLIPIASNCRNLTSLRLYDMTIDKQICLDDLPISLRLLSLNKVSFECDTKFFFSKTNRPQFELERLEIESTNFGCFSFILCFSSTLKTLIMKDIEHFNRLHFTVLQWRFLELEKFVVDTEYGVDKEVLTVLRTFPKLKHLELKDKGQRKSFIVALGELFGFDGLETLTLHNVIMSRVPEVELPVLPSLKRATVRFLSIDNTFFSQLTNMFPILTSLIIDGNRNINNGLFPSALMRLGAHPTLKCLHLEKFLILQCRFQNQPSVIQHSSRIVRLVLLNCSIYYEVLPFVVSCFPNVNELSLEQVEFRVESANACASRMLQGMSHLRRVRFAGQFVTDLFLEVVTPALSENIQHLELCSDDVAFGNHSMKTIAENVPGLKTLKIESNRISFDGIVALSKLKNLEQFDLDTERITMEKLENVKRFLTIMKLPQ